MKIAALSLLFGSIAVGALAQTSVKLNEPVSTLLPSTFGAFHAVAGSNVPQSPLSLVNVSKDALEEAKPQRSQVGDYTNGTKTIHVEGVEFADRTGALSAYTLVRRIDMTPVRNLGTLAAVGSDAVVFTLGDSVVMAYPLSDAEAKLLKPLSEALPKSFGNKGVAPLLPTLAPRVGLVESSMRYALGPHTYAAQGGVLPAAQLGWNKEAEALTANYKDERGDETVTLLYYPTPTIAGALARTVQSMADSAGTRLGVVKVRREGNIVMLASGTFAADQAQKMMENIHQPQRVSFDQDIQPSVPQQVHQVATLLENILVLSGVLMAAAVLLGLFLGGGRALYRVARGRPAATEVEFLSLHLDPINAPAKFEPPNA
ncbi:MAG: DUF6599 family protein [Bryocella sp.]